MDIADKNEILEFYTRVLRGEDIENLPAMMRAAECLGRYYGLNKSATSETLGDVIIIDDIPK